MNDTSSLYCTFRTGGHLFGVPVLDVREVTTETNCTRIPHAPVEVAGYVSIRGHIYLALNLRCLLGLTGAPELLDRCMVLFKPTVGPAFGILVDEIGDIVAVPKSSTKTLINHRADSSHDDRFSVLVERVCTLPGELLAVLDPRRFLPFVEESFARV